MAQPILKNSLLITAALSLALAVLGPVLPVSAALSNEGNSYMEKAQSLEKSGDMAGAIIQLKNAIRIDPDLVAARYALALLYLRAGEAPSAQAELETARTHGLAEEKIIPPLVQAYFAQTKFKEVINNFDPAKVSGEPQSELFAMQARAQVALDNVPAAHALLDKALAQSPSNLVVLATAATVARKEKRYPDAEKYIDQGLAKDADNSEMLILKAEARQVDKDYDGALKYLDHAIEKQPRNVRARLARGLINLARNKPELIPADVTEVLAADPKNQFGLYLRAVSLSLDGKYRDAVGILLTIPALVGNYPPARYLLAAASFADNQLQSALDNAELYLKAVPGDPTASKLIAATSLRLKNYKRAVEILEPLVKARPDDSQAQIQLANAYLGVGRSAEAVKLFEAGVKANPEDPGARMALATSQLQSGAVDAGVASLQELIKLKPDSVQANQLLVLANLQAKHYDKALVAADAMIKASPNDPTSYNVKGTASLGANDPVGARAAFKMALTKNDKYTPAMLNLAHLEERNKDLKAAKDWYQKVLTVEPHNQNAFSGLVNIALGEKNVDEALKILDQAVAADPSDPLPRLRQIDILLEGKQAGRALVAASSLANALPDDPRAIDALARAQILNNEVAAGISTYRRLVTAVPHNAEARRRLGRALVAASVADASAKPDASGKVVIANDRLMDEAKISLDAALAEDPDYTNALTDRIALEQKLSGNAAALKLAQKYVQDRPASLVRLVILGDLASATGKTDVAVTSYRAVWEKAKNSGNLLRLYSAMVRDNKGAEGLQMLKKWAADNPTDYDTRFMIASAAISEGRFDDAIKETESMSGNLPENPVLLNNLAWLYGEKNNPRAFEFAQKAVEIAPNSPDVLDTAGWLEAQKRDIKKGVTLLAKSYELANDNPTIAYHYASALKKDGNAQKAKEVLKKALDSKRDFKERSSAQSLLKELGG